MIVDEDRPVEFTERTEENPRILVGKPVVKGTRIPVSLILNLVAHGALFAEIVADYPSLTEDDVRSAILYAGARLDREPVGAVAVRP